MNNQRDSGIELLRIIAALFVVILHYCNPDIGGAIVRASGVNLLLLELLRSLSSCAVDVFILISGYFLIKSDRRVLGKPLSLFLQLLVMHVIGYLAKVGFHGFDDFSVIVLLRKCLVTNYFITLYTVLYLLSPLLNMLIANMNKRVLQKVLIVLFCVFSFYTTLWDVIRELSGNEFYGTSTIGNWGSQHGYTIVNFVVLYVTGAYLRLFGPPRIISTHWLIIILLCVLSIYVWGHIPSYLPEGASSARSYHNPVVILLAVTLFVVSCKLKIKSRIINELAKAAFTCYLLHLFIIGQIHASIYAQESFFVLCLHIFGSLLLIYLMSYVFYKLYDFAFSPLTRWLNRYALSYSSEDALIVKQ